MASSALPSLLIDHEQGTPAFVHVQVFDVKHGRVCVHRYPLLSAGCPVLQPSAATATGIVAAVYQANRGLKGNLFIGRSASQKEACHQRGMR